LIKIQKFRKAEDSIAVNDRKINNKKFKQKLQKKKRRRKGCI